MTQMNHGRRKLLKLSAFVPATWLAPVIEVVSLPAHAQATTPGGGCSAEWDRSSFGFLDQGCIGSDLTGTVILVNTGEPATCDVRVDIHYLSDTDPNKNNPGTVVRTVLVTPDKFIQYPEGVPVDMYSSPFDPAGHYAAEVFQHPGHPGTGTAWSPACVKLKDDPFS
jgi:hypothetical protein